MTLARVPSPDTGTAVNLIAEIQGASAARAGSLTFRLLTGGGCTDLTLVPISPTVSTASCEVTFSKPGNYELVAEYNSGAEGQERWAPAVSEPMFFSVQSEEFIFSGDFEE